MKKSRLLPILILVIGLVIFIFKSIDVMRTVPFYDFDEAHRAENAKRMKEYGSYLVPLTGSSFDRVEHLKIRFRDNPEMYLYYHLERPPLVYILMMVTTQFLGGSEFGYRFASFLMGLLTLAALVIFVIKENHQFKFIPSCFAILSLLTSADLWLSSQYAQMDTSITFFLFLSLILLLFYVERRKFLTIFFSGLSLGLGVFSKGQPAVIFAFPLLFLLANRKINIKELAIFALGTLLVIFPWFLYLAINFGLKDTVSVFPGFAISSASIVYQHHIAPVFWYVRWWWESFRPGWTLFLVLQAYDFLTKSSNWKKGMILSYILGGLILFSLPVNKLWWYILPLVPAVSLYIYESSKDLLLKDSKKIVNLSLITIIASLPISKNASNTEAMTFGMLVTAICLLILPIKYLGDIFKKPINSYFIYLISLGVGLLFFYFHFPKIIPYHVETKPVAQYFNNLPGRKCLWIYDMPVEAALFYSNAGEIKEWHEESALYASCQNYLITAVHIREKTPILRQGPIRLYKLDQNN